MREWNTFENSQIRGKMEHEKQNEGSQAGTSAVLRETHYQKHKLAESQPFQVAMAKGNVTTAAYAAFLKQMLHVHEAVETPLRAVVANRPAWVPMFTRSRWRVERIRGDLASIQIAGCYDPPGPTVLILRQRIAEVEAAPHYLLGAFYVLEGSTNGSRHIVRNLSHYIGLQVDRGLGYLDPYGSEQPESWAEFKSALDGLELDESQLKMLIAAAGDMYDVITGIGQELAEKFLAA